MVTLKSKIDNMVIAGCMAYDKKLKTYIFFSRLIIILGKGEIKSLANKIFAVLMHEKQVFEYSI